MVKEAACSGDVREDGSTERLCQTSALRSFGACRPGVCGNYRRLTFRAGPKGWVKVQFIPFKEKKNSHYLTFQFEMNQSEATRARDVWRKAFSSGPEAAEAGAS